MRRILLASTTVLLPLHEALGQRTPARLNFVVAPPSPTALGQLATLGIRPMVPGTTYRYVATMTFTGTGMLAASTTCAAPQTIGTGSRVSWTPASGAYRLTVHTIKSLAAHDSASVSYQVNAPNGGYLNMTVTQNPNPQPPGRFMLSLHTNARAAGSRYQWVVRFTPAFGAPSGPPVDWAGDSPTPVYSVPFVLTPGTYNVSARVGIHQGDPCRIVETSIGALNGQVIH